MEVLPSDATWAILGSYKVSVGILSWHNNQVDAYRQLKAIREDGGTGRVVPVIDGQLDKQGQQEKVELFQKFHERIFKTQ